MNWWQGEPLTDWARPEYLFYSKAPWHAERLVEILKSAVKCIGDFLSPMHSCVYTLQ